MSKTKKQIIEEFRINENDVGSLEVQIALLTNRINELTEHFKGHPKDFASKRGLLMMVGRRRRYLKYIERQNPNKYQKLIESLGLRK